MLVISRGSMRYRGRYMQKATDLVNGGTRVGMMYVASGAPPEAKARCHVCESDFILPTFEQGQQDHWGECTHCKTPFVFVQV